MSDWISARLKVNRPTTKGPVLVFCKTDDEPDGKVSMAPANFVHRQGKDAILRITHWQPLPAPPGKDDEKILPIEEHAEAFLDQLRKRLQAFRESRRHGADSLLDARIDELEHMLIAWDRTAARKPQP